MTPSQLERLEQLSLNIDGTLERNQRHMDDWLLRLQDLIERAEKLAAKSEPKP